MVSGDDGRPIEEGLIRRQGLAAKVRLGADIRHRLDYSLLVLVERRHADATDHVAPVSGDGESGLASVLG